MFPLVAIGAALLGGFAAFEVSSNQDSKSSESSHHSRSSGDSATVSPQSYIVTPIENGASQGQSQSQPTVMSAADAVQRLVF